MQLKQDTNSTLQVETELDLVLDRKDQKKAVRHDSG
jgi:hypothetical protein